MNIGDVVVGAMASVQLALCEPGCDTSQDTLAYTPKPWGSSWWRVSVWIMWRDGVLLCAFALFSELESVRMSVKRAPWRRV